MPHIRRDNTHDASGKTGLPQIDRGRTEAFNRITWILLNKAGLIRDITVGDCVEISNALQEHQCRGAITGRCFMCCWPILACCSSAPADPEGDQDGRPALPLNSSASTVA